MMIMRLPQSSMDT